MSAHTPGPWNYRTSPQPNGCPIVGAQGLMVAMLAHSVNEADQKEAAYANAALIAAAPDLLAACLAIAKWGDCEQDYSVGFSTRLDLCRAAFDSARAAIAKATNP